MQSKFFRDGQHTYVVLRPVQNLAEPDLLLYWIAGTPQEKVLPADARLLGAFTPGKAYAIPDAPGPGYLVLYSLGHQSVSDMASLEKLP